MTRSSQFELPLSIALKQESLNSAAATTNIEELRRKLDLPFGDTGMDATQVVEELVSGVGGGILDLAGGRFFGWVIGGSLPAALAADWLTSAWDQNAALCDCAPGTMWRAGAPCE